MVGMDGPSMFMSNPLALCWLIEEFTLDALLRLLGSLLNKVLVQQSDGHLHRLRY